MIVAVGNFYGDSVQVIFKLCEWCIVIKVPWLLFCRLQSVLSLKQIVKPHFINVTVLSFIIVMESVYCECTLFV